MSITPTRKPAPLHRQRGIITALAAVILVAAVLYVLTQSLGIIGKTSQSNQTQGESIAAFFLAESGLERAVSVVRAAADDGTMGETVCTGGIASGGPFTLSTGSSFSYANTALPSGCTGTACIGCTVQATGTVGSASRTLSLIIKTESNNGAHGFGGRDPIISMSLKNTVTPAVPGVALFNLAWRRHGTDGPSNASASVCGLPSCNLEWNVESSSGVPSAGSLGSSVGIDASGSFTVTQTLEGNRNYTEVGVLFPFLTSTVVSAGSFVVGTTYNILTVGSTDFTVIGARNNSVGQSFKATGVGTGSGTAYLGGVTGSYWDNINAGGGLDTVNNTATSPSKGETKNGVAANVAGTCTVPLANDTGTDQDCNSWCYGADTLAFGVSARSDTFADEITGVTFNTGLTPSRDIAMTRVVHYPNTSGSPSSSGDIYSAMFYAYNPNLSPASSPTAANASSYKGNGTGAIGATWTGANNSASDVATVPTLFVGTFPAYPSRIISVGDTISSSGGSGNISGTPTIVGQLTSTEPGGVLGGRGTYQLNTSQTVAAVAGRDWTASSSVLNVSACTVCFFASGDVVSSLVANKTINSQLTLRGTEATGGVGRYVLSSSGVPALPTTAASATVRAGTPGTTLYLPSTESMPTVTTPNTIIAIFSASPTGAFNGTTTVTAVSPLVNSFTNAFTVTPQPATALSGDAICAGTCAFFRSPTVISAAAGSNKTEFTVTRSGGTSQWAGAFSCLSGIDRRNIRAVTDTTTTPSNWHEVVR